MKYLREKVASGKHEWRIIGDTAEAGVFVVSGSDVYEFRNDREAYSYVIGEYRKVADLRNMQPGQAYQMTMADGTQKTVNVQTQGPQSVIVMDSQTGETMNIPHLQSGAEPTPAPTQKPKVPGSPGGPTPTPNISPENMTAVLCQNDLMRVNAGEVGREPYYCKHDRGYLYRKDPSAPEKYCAECGMVYAASKQAKIIADDECVNCGKHSKVNDEGECPKCSRRKGAGKRERAEDVQREDQEEKNRQDAHESDSEDWSKDYDSDDDREAQRTAGGNCPKCGGDGRWMDIGCHLCGGVGMVDEHKAQQYIEKVRQNKGDDYVNEYLRRRREGGKEPNFYDDDDDPTESVEERSERESEEEYTQEMHDKGFVRDPGSSYWRHKNMSEKRKKKATITGGPGSYHVKSEEGKNLGGPYKSKEQAEHRLKQVEYFKHKKSEFRNWKNEHRIIRARDIQADAPMPGQQGMPSGDVANDSQTQLSQQMKEKSPMDFAEDGETQPAAGPNAKRRLTPHEIIEEAESLIRNALVKGVKIGGAELVEYMTQYYSNSPEDVMQGVTLAWQKVQYEEQTESGQPAPDSAGMGPKAPTTPDEAAAMAPKNGPIQTKTI